MAKFPTIDAYALVNAVDLSDHLSEVNLGFDRDTPEGTSMGDVVHSFIAGGLEANTMSINFFADQASSNVNATLYSIHSGNAAVTVVVGAAGSSASSTNPHYSGSWILQNYNPISGAVGGAAMITSNWVRGAGTALTQVTA